MQRDRLFLTLAYSRSKSVTTSLTALRFIIEYGRTCDVLEDVVSITTYADHVGLSVAQAYRRQAAFRTCFPKDDVLVVWKIVRPLLDASPFKNEAPAAQAVYVATLKAGTS